MNNILVWIDSSIKIKSKITRMVNSLEDKFDSIILVTKNERIASIYRSEFKNVYGPTECTCICSSYKVNHDDLNSDDLLPLGLISNNFSYMIVNENNQLVKDGEIGELLLGGNNVGKGYVGEKEKTSKVFFNVLNLYYL